MLLHRLALELFCASAYIWASAGPPSAPEGLSGRSNIGECKLRERGSDLYCPLDDCKHIRLSAVFDKKILEERLFLLFEGLWRVKLTGGSSGVSCEWMVS